MANQQDISVDANRAYKDTLVIETTSGDLVGASARLRIWVRGDPDPILIDKALPIPDPQVPEVTFILTSTETAGLTPRVLHTYQVDVNDSSGQPTTIIRGRLHVGPEYPY